MYQFVPPLFSEPTKPFIRALFLFLISPNPTKDGAGIKSEKTMFERENKERIEIAKR